MRLKIDIAIPSWSKWLVGGLALGIVIGLVGARVYADTISIKTNFVNGEILSAGDMNTNFQKLQDAINQAAPPGTVVAFAGFTPPSGWLLCDGGAVSRTQYPGLFAAISVTYGIGDAVSTFNLPDLRAAGIRGVGESTRFQSNTAVTLGQKIDDSMQGHIHSFASSNNANQFPPPVVTFTWSSSTWTSASGNANNAMISNSNPESLAIGNPYADGTHDPPRTGNETTGKAIGMNYIIKY